MPLLPTAAVSFHSYKWFVAWAPGYLENLLVPGCAVALPGYAGGLVVADHLFPHLPMVDVNGSHQYMVLCFTGWCHSLRGPSVVSHAGSSVLRPHLVLGQTTHLTTFLGPIPPLLLATALHQLPVLVAGMAPVLAGSGAFFTTLLEFYFINDLLLHVPGMTLAVGSVPFHGRGLGMVLGLVWSWYVSFPGGSTSCSGFQSLASGVVVYIVDHCIVGEPSSSVWMVYCRLLSVLSSSPGLGSSLMVCSQLLSRPLFKPWSWFILRSSTCCNGPSGSSRYSQLLEWFWASVTAWPSRALWLEPLLL